ncbi:hypothetical protein GWI33_017568 [Rhynchophorus ferrugineus]|uniref:Ig-like domain-containing protein n=1 Tax=Rhynchophorus ferrugineus TaxID=354439 RepID=A0A834HY78_RHYFE|nr:hypothetical protein GWI33_017568 [Rhynchophorus ferrugineus]
MTASGDERHSQAVANEEFRVFGWRPWSWRFIQIFFRVDVRGRPVNKALRWSDKEVFGPRAYFVFVSKPAALTLEGVQLDDQGIYRCRVDFKTSPTRNFAINLTVIVPPHQLILYDNSGRDVSNVVGPLQEGSDLILTCEVRGETIILFILNETETNESEPAFVRDFLPSRPPVPSLSILYPDKQKENLQPGLSANGIRKNPVETGRKRSRTISGCIKETTEIREPPFLIKIYRAGITGSTCTASLNRYAARMVGDYAAGTDSTTLMKRIH